MKYAVLSKYTMFYEVLVLLLIHVASFNLSSWPAVRLRPSTCTRLHSVDPEYLLEQARTRSTFTRLYSVDPDDLLEQAARLREEADAIIREKTEVAAVAQEEERTTAQNNAAYKSQFSVDLPILKDTGKEVDEEVFFKPLFPQPEVSEMLESHHLEYLSLTQIASLAATCNSSRKFPPPSVAKSSASTSLSL